MPYQDPAFPDAVKDEEAAHPVPAAWRPILAEIVRALVRGDYHLLEPIAGVEPVRDETARQMSASVADYAATLVELPPEAWETSCAQWMGEYWQVLCDLWTKEEGASDLVLEVYVAESNTGYRFTVQLVYVP